MAGRNEKKNITKSKIVNYIINNKNYIKSRTGAESELEYADGAF